MSTLTVATVSTTLVCFLSSVFPLFSFTFVDTLLICAVDSITLTLEGRELIAITIRGLTWLPRIVLSNHVIDLIDAQTPEDAFLCLTECVCLT